MNTSKNEFLSSLLDDEAGDFEKRRLLDELTKDDELAQTFTRYALMGEVMRNHASGQRSTTSMSLLSRIQEELEDEPAYTGEVAVKTPAPVKTNARRFWQTGGLALAATVAAVAVGATLFLQQPKDSTEQANTPADQAVAGLSVATVNEPAVVSTQTQVAEAITDERIRQVGRIDPQTRDILKKYVTQHIKYASTTVIVPSVRAVSYADEN